MGYGNEWVWVAAIGVLLFGAAKLPQLAKNLGEGIREFKKSVSSEPNATKTVKPSEEK